MNKSVVTHSADDSLQPLISVVMSVYNDEEFLSESIRSILEQSYTNFEFIIVDDGSTDNSLQLIGKFASQDTRIETISRENQGLALSLNEAIKQARGRYIARMDSDDIARPERLQIQVEYLMANPEIDILGGQASLIDENGNVLREINKPVSWPSIHQYLNFASPLIHPTYLVKTDVYRQLGCYRNFKVAQDFDFLLRADEAGYRLGNVAESVLLYRENKSGLSAGNAMRQMRSGRLMLKLRHFRIAGKEEPEKILSSLQSRAVIASGWFDFLWGYRNRALISSKNSTGLSRLFCLIAVVLISLFHFEIFYASYRVWRSTRWKDLLQLNENSE